MRQLAKAAALGALLGLIAAWPEAAMDAVRSACRQWAGRVAPALFPYMVISRLLLACSRSGRLLVPLALLGGSPASAKLIHQSGARGAQAQRYAALCATASPMFLLGTLGGGWRMLVAHWAGAVLSYIAIAALFPVGTKKTDAPGNPLPPVSLAESIRDGAQAMLFICGCMAFFAVLIALYDRLLPGGTLAACALEMATGCLRLGALGLPEAQTTPLLCAAASFGGLSVFVQNAAFLRPAGVRLVWQLGARLVHAGAAYAVCRLIYLF